MAQTAETAGPDAVSSIREALAEARQRLAASESAALDAEVLLADTIGRDRAYLYANPEWTVPAETLSRFRERVERRRHGEPVAYLTGGREFWSLRFEVTPDVLIPRPETELLVERALALIPRDAHRRIADLGTGSGAIALAIASERPGCEVHAVDASEPALAVARRNARRLRLERIQFHLGSWCAPLKGEFHLIVCNPPYVAAADPHLSFGDCRHEPREALTPPSGNALASLEAVAAQARPCLVRDGWLLLEHGADQGAAVRALLTAHSYKNVATARDLSGHERITSGQAN